MDLKYPNDNGNWSYLLFQTEEGAVIRYLAYLVAIAIAGSICVLF